MGFCAIGAYGVAVKELGLSYRGEDKKRVEGHPHSGRLPQGSKDFKKDTLGPKVCKTLPT